MKVKFVGGPMDGKLKEVLDGVKWFHTFEFVCDLEEDLSYKIEHTYEYIGNNKFAYKGAK